MKRCIYLLIIILTWWPLLPVHAQNDSPSPQESDLANPAYRELDEQNEPNDTQGETQTDAQKKQDELLYNLGIVADQGDELQQAFGTLDDKGNYSPGTLKTIKLKPSDKKRLIKLANGSLSDKQKKTVNYDARALDLLVHLGTPTELGGAGFDYLRVQDFLRFRQDPRSRETENADNVSAHQYGKAVDITEINTTYCTQKTSGAFGIGGSETKLPPFPVKVIWQGGAPHNPTSAELGSFDAVARANALRDILGSLPTDTYSGSIQGMTDLLQQLQRRVLAEELNLDRGSLDYLINNDVLETLGRAALNQKLALAPGALTGNSRDENLRSIPEAALEQSLNLPPQSFRGDLKDAVERLGRYKVALDNNIDPQDILAGKTNEIKSSPYYSYYKDAEAAFRLPKGSLSGVLSNNASAFRQVGAQLLADRLGYSPNDAQDLIKQAQSGTLNQLSLARKGDLPLFPGNALLLLAPGSQSSKTKGEHYLSQQIIDRAGTFSLNTLDEAKDQITSRFPNLKASTTRGELIDFLASQSPQSVSPLYRQIGLTYMEKVFDLPGGDLIKAVQQANPPSLDQYEAIIGPDVLNDALADNLTQDEIKQFPADEQPLLHASLGNYFNKNQYPQAIDTHLSLPAGSTQKRYQGQLSQTDYTRLVGKAFMENDFVETFNDLYHTSQIGLGKVSLDEMFTLVFGQINDAATRAGASWVEEDLGLAPDSFSVFFTKVDPEERLVNAGINVLAGNLWDSFEIDAQNINDLQTLKQRVGQAKVETLLGLKPGSFHTSLASVKTDNPRFDQIFASPSTVDAILGTKSGTAQSFKNGSGSPESIITTVGNLLFDKIDVATLHTKLGWDDRFKLVDPATLQNNPTPYLTDYDGATLRQLLAKIGGFNLDISFGYEPNTTDKWIHANSVDQNQILADAGGKLYADRLGFDPKNDQSIIDSYRTGSQSAKDTAMAKLKDLYHIPNQGDLASFVDGEMIRARFAPAIVKQTQLNKLPTNIIDGDPYEVFHTMMLGWSNDPNYEQRISQEAIDRVQKILTQDYAVSKSNSLLDRAFERISQGALDSNGSFLAGTSPYSSGNLDGIRHDYYTIKEAQGDYLFGLVDQKILQKNSQLPLHFSEVLMEGANQDRSSMIYRFLDSKISDGILNSLPANLQSTVASWLKNPNPNQGALLATNSDFGSWASNIFSQYSDNSISGGAMQLAVQYLSGGISPQIISENPTSFYDLSPSTMSGLINKQLGLDAGAFESYYDSYQQVQTTISDYKDGNLDASQALFTIDNAVFGGQIAQFTQAIDSTFGLPDGSTQLLISYAITQNPLYLVQFGLNVLGLGGGTEVQCPDLQKEAQKNIKKLVSAVVDAGQEQASAIPSQIIIFDPNMITQLTDEIGDKIRNNYNICTMVANSRCGIFAAHEYADRIHIGF